MKFYKEYNNLSQRSKLFIKEHLIYIILLFATILRLFNISKRDFWYDEAFTGVAIKENFLNMMNMIIQDVHPPLYYISVKLFASFFNYSVFGIRLYSAAFGILGVWAVYLFTKELFNKKAALWASLITAISPFAIQYSQEARMYSMLGFLIVIASYFFIRWLKTNRIKYNILFGMFLGLACLTHYMGVMFTPIFYFVFLTWKFAINGSLHKKFNFKKFLQELIPSKELIFGYLVAFLVFIPWLSNFVEHLTRRGNLHWTMPAKLSDIFFDIQIFLFGSPLGEMSSGMPSPNELYGIATTTVFMLVIIFISLIIFFLVKKEKEKIFIVLLFSLGFMAIIYLLSQAGKHYFVARFLIAASYFVFILIGVWLSKIKIRFSFSFLTLYVVLLSSTINVGYSKGYNEFANNLNKYENNNLYVLNSFDYVIAKYYIGADRLTLFNIDWPEYNSSGWAAIGNNLKKIKKYEDLKNDKNALVIFNSQVLFENRSDKSFNPREDGFVLVDKYENLKIYKFNNEN